MWLRSTDAGRGPEVGRASSHGPLHQVALHVIDDNPTSLDLLGFGAVVTPVVEAICREDPRSLTIGVRGGWGSGKSSFLRLVEDVLRREHQEELLVLRVDPWEFESGEQLRSMLVETILTDLHSRVEDTVDLGERVRRLIARVRFGRIAASLIKGAAAVPLDGGWGIVGQLVKGVTDLDSFVAPANDQVHLPATMHGFRAEFSDLIETVHADLGIEKVVMLVDDLDRCLPDAVVQSLEAIKLFLAVNRMVFVVSADEDMVRAAIAASLAGTGRSNVFANLYLEKIVQLPLTLPALTRDDAVTYATLLLCASGDQEIYEQMREHCQLRRASNATPLLDEFSHTPQTRFSEDLARQICSGLDAETAINPRRIKRFLNNFVVRRSIAAARGVHLSAAATAKLMLLEERFLDPDFRVLAGTPVPDLRQLLQQWEAWARGSPNSQQPEGVSDGSRGWAASAPSLAESDENIAAYLTLAAALTASASGGALSGKVAHFIDQLIGHKDSDVMRTRLIDIDLRGGFADVEVEQVMFAVAARASTISPPDHAIRLIVEIAESRPSVATAASSIIAEKLAHVVDLGVAAKLGTSTVPEIVKLAERLAEDLRVTAEGRRALREAMTQRP